LSPIDFERRDWVPHSGWPIRAADLYEYLERAERALGLPAFRRFAELSALEDSDPKERAVFADGDLAPTVALWAPKPLRFGKIHKRKLRKSANMRVYLHANVTEVVANEAGTAVDRLDVATLTGKRFAARARCYVLACGGLENARLLLVSRRRHASGIGNAHDVVGRYYLDHPRALVGRVRLNRPVALPYLTGQPLADGKVQVGIALSERAQREERVLNSYLSIEPQMSELAARQYGRTVNVLKTLLKRGHSGSRFDFKALDMSGVREMVYLLTPKELMPHFLYRYYAMLKRAARKTLSATYLTVINFCEQVPDPRSRVSLSGDTDRLGMRKLKLDWRVGDQEVRSLARLHARFAARLRAAGIGTLEDAVTEETTASFIDASHHLGTARMSEDPQHGVVDKHCRVHGMPNLFIAGSAVFPTGGHANPTLTIVALAIRLADHLKARSS
jgi:choline dehydrogenase-like flavoprotein